MVLFYSRSFWSRSLLVAILAVKNIFDKTYYSASGGDLRVSIGTPRTAFASLAATF